MANYLDYLYGFEQSELRKYVGEKMIELLAEWMPDGDHWGEWLGKIHHAPTVRRAAQSKERSCAGRGQGSCGVCAQSLCADSGVSSPEQTHAYDFRSIAGEARAISVSWHDQKADSSG